ncbi:hypothetical protein [Escherichia coli]
MTITAAEFHDAFPDMGRQHAEARLKGSDESPLGQVNQSSRTRKNEKSSAGCSTGRSISKLSEVSHFSDAIMPYLTQLKGQFTRVVVKNVSISFL